MMFLVATFPILFFPVMGPTIWDKPVVRRNVARIREDGHEVIEPAWREQYEPDFGRMYGHYTLPEPDDVLSIIKSRVAGGRPELVGTTGAGVLRPNEDGGQ
jgi:phosphopantothenoylcysteine decarboxylase/phosphopantothenate--cysteine ligase